MRTDVFYQNETHDRTLTVQYSADTIPNCSRRSHTPNTKLLERVYSQIRRHMLRYKHIGPTRWHHKEDDEDVEHDEHEHVEHGDAKRDQTWRH